MRYVLIGLLLAVYSLLYAMPTIDAQKSAAAEILAQMKASAKCEPIADARFALEQGEKAKVEAAKFIFYKGAYGLALDGKDYALAAEILQKIVTDIADVPASVRDGFVEDALARVPEEQRKSFTDIRLSLSKTESSVSCDTKPAGTGAQKLSAGDTKTITLPGGATLELVWCPSGSFAMGNKSRHQVRLTRGFWLGKYEITQRQWVSVMGTNPSRFMSPDRPVERVSWEDCQLFIRAVQQSCPEFNVRLPTDAEWEYACRAGTETTLPNGRDLLILGERNAPVLDDIAWYAGNSCVGFELSNGHDCSQWSEMQYSGSITGTHPVGKKAANAWGLHDMIGNVCEWCSDWYNSAYTVAVDPENTSSPQKRDKDRSCRVVRGGGWLTIPRFCNSAERYWRQPSDHAFDLGFRLACSPTNMSEKASAASTDSTSALGGVQLWENGPYWAECNVGASKPWEYGYYFWWGDTVGYTHDECGWNAADGSKNGFTFDEKNCPTDGKNNSELLASGYIDSTGKLVAAHDAATVHLGPPWRMPTDDEMGSIVSNCTAKWITTNGVPGCLVTGKGDYASRSIFLPAAGVGYKSGLGRVGSEGYYYSSVPCSYNFNRAYYLYFRSGDFNRYDNYRIDGFSVRPLREFAQ